jgi:hypothetical protein
MHIVTCLVCLPQSQQFRWAFLFEPLLYREFRKCSLVPAVLIHCMAQLKQLAVSCSNMLLLIAGSVELKLILTESGRGCSGNISRNLWVPLTTDLEPLLYRIQAFSRDTRRGQPTFEL